MATYETKPTVGNAVRVGLQGAAVGAFVSAIQNALDKHTRGAMGFLTRTGSTIGVFGTHNHQLLDNHELSNWKLQPPWAQPSHSPNARSLTGDR